MPKMPRQTKPAKNITTLIEQYELKEDLSLPARIADCLAWASKECPLQYVPFTALLRAMFGKGIKVGPNSKELDKLRSRWGAVRDQLLKNYKKGLVIERGHGARATVGDEDVANSVLPTRIMKLERAQVGIAKTLEIVDSKNIRDTVTRRWVESLTPAFKQLSSPDLMNKLLPPGKKS